MFKTAQEFKEAACTMLKKIRDGEMDYNSPGLPDPYYKYVVDYIIQEGFVADLYGARTPDGKFLVGDPLSPRVTRKGAAFIRSMEREN